MPTKSKLKMALAAEKGIDFSKLDQKKKSKLSRKEKSKKAEEQQEVDREDEEADGGAALSDTDEEEEEDDDEVQFDIDAINDSDSDSSDDDEIEEENEEGEDDEDIPMSDIESLPEEEREDLIPHQRLTINNISALKSSLKRIALPIDTLPFTEHQAITSDEPVAIADVSDDLNRELSFYAQALEAAKLGRAALRKEGVSFTRPNDYFAEMVKADDHMEKIKAKLVEEAAGKKAAAEARKLRDLKKFGKKVQVAKQQERDKERKQTLEKIKDLKRKRQDAGSMTATNEPEMFDIALEDASQANKRGSKRGGGYGPGSNNKSGRGAGGPASSKRQKRDSKFGFGGSKRFSKSGDAVSSGDLSGFNPKKMRAGGKPGPKKGSGASKRPGKARRASAKF